MGRRVEKENGFWKTPLPSDESEDNRKSIEKTETEAPKADGQETEAAKTEVPKTEKTENPDRVPEKVPEKVSEAVSEEAEEETQTAESVQETREAEGGASGDVPVWPWFAAAAALVVVLGTVLFCVLKRKKRRIEKSRIKEGKTKERKTKESNAGAVDASAPEACQKPESVYFYGMNQSLYDGCVSVALVGNIHHIGGREEQQDSFAVSDFTDEKMNREKGCLAVVADGMGGLSDGGKISAMITASMLCRFETGSFSGDAGIPMELLRTVQEINGEVLQFLDKDAGQSGSTVVAAWICGGRLHYISVGDSRICLIRGGTLTVLNREHTYGSELDEKAARGEISFKEARTDPQRHALTSYIGISPLKKIDRSFHGVPLLPGDKVLLMSDGVFGTLSEAEILAGAGWDALAMAEDLQRRILACQKPEQDNFTAVILQCE